MAINYLRIIWFGHSCETLHSRTGKTAVITPEIYNNNYNNYTRGDITRHFNQETLPEILNKWTHYFTKYTLSGKYNNNFIIASSCCLITSSGINLFVQFCSKVICLNKYTDKLYTNLIQQINSSISGSKLITKLYQWSKPFLIFCLLLFFF